MALMADATWNPAGATPGGYIDPRVVIFHVTAGLGDARPHSGLEWHFEVSLSGAIQQQVDTNRRADANNKANPFAISVETEGKGEGYWTDPQVKSLVKISEWSMAHHPKIKRQRCDRWDGSGFGYHVMWGAPGPWTPVAKSCPGPNRIKQFDKVLLPAILAGGLTAPPTPPEEDDMPACSLWRFDGDIAIWRVAADGQSRVHVPSPEALSIDQYFLREHGEVLVANSPALRAWLTGIPDRTK